uniref:Uncharacterized protein n=1 Tax=Glossina austeni TaxID=7395 RepID=A0A1A9V5M5_GLOAU
MYMSLCDDEHYGLTIKVFMLQSIRVYHRRMTIIEVCDYVCNLQKRTINCAGKVKDSPQNEFLKTKMETFEPSEVVAKYLALFEQDRFDFKYYFAPNSVIDWYGRTIRGVNKIHYYLRNEVSRNCKHVGFLHPVSCAPIERRTTHMATKIITNKSEKFLKCINTASASDILSMKSYAPSGVNHSMETERNLLKTPEKYRPPTMPEANGNNKTLLILLETERYRYVPRLSTVPDGSSSAFYAKGNFRGLKDSLNDEKKRTTLASLYTPLRYVEVKGTMRMSWLTPEALPRPCYDERATCLRISYRVSMRDNEVQFALVIYEVIGAVFPFTNVRRSLEIAFSKVPKKDEGNIEDILVPKRDKRDNTNADMLMGADQDLITETYKKYNANA